MKTFKAWRFKCDFCGKNMRQRNAMAKHEAGCTLNPQRICRLHEYATGSPLLVSAQYLADVLFSHQRDIDHGLQALRDHCDNCPACILAAIRLAGFCSGTGKEGHIENGEYVSDYVEPLIGKKQFDFKKELEQVWIMVNDARQEERFQKYGYTG